ncbi:MAG: hypothetical protein HQL93_12220 [Magnetococcales bacterium]|nr:hypothetical protein [Magnetococcales bacterium]
MAFLPCALKGSNPGYEAKQRISLRDRVGASINMRDLSIAAYPMSIFHHRGCRQSRHLRYVRKKSEINLVERSRQ